MTETCPISVDPAFLSRPGGQLFSILIKPREALPRYSVLLCPPLGEEMNRCRRMMRLAAERLAGEGIAVLGLDLHGTGDSSGDFSDAAWETWIADLDAGMRWLSQRMAGKVGLLAIRGGCLLAWEILRQRPDAFDRLVFWQPVLTGRAVVTDLLRLRVAAGMADQASQETTADLRRQLASGKTVETGGYNLAPGLASALDRQGITAEGGVHGFPIIHWLEVYGDTQTSVRPATHAAIRELEGTSARVRYQRVTGPFFWSTTEITVAPELLEATIAAFSDAPTR